MQRRHLFILLAFALFASPLAAQETTGKIQGRVVDAQSLAVPGATVMATGVQGSKNTVTDGDGRYTIPFLTPGVYSVRAELQGFKAIEQKDVSVRVGQTADVPLKLEVGGVAEVVQVTGAARVVDTSSTTIGAVINTDDLKSIPVGRTFAATLYLTPGVSSSGTAGVAKPVDFRRHGPREPVRRGRHERHEHGLRRPRVLLDHVRLVRQRDTVRLHQGSPGQDRRV